MRQLPLDAIFVWVNRVFKHIFSFIQIWNQIKRAIRMVSYVLYLLWINRSYWFSFCQSEILYSIYFKPILWLLYVKFDEKANLHNLTTINLRTSFLVRKCMEIFDFLSSEYWQSGHILNISINLETCYRTCWQSNRFPSLLHFKWFLG